MNNTEIIVALAFDVANMESENNARAQARVPISNNNTSNIFFI